MVVGDWHGDTEWAQKVIWQAKALLGGDAKPHGHRPESVRGGAVRAREGEPDEPLARQATMLARKAGADPGAIPAWAAEGRRRRASARRPPFSGGLR